MLIKRIACLVIGFLILFADSGQTVYARTCAKSGTTTLALLKFDECKSERACCAEKHHGAHKECSIQETNNKCCTVSAAYVKQSFPTDNLKQLHIEKQEVAMAITPALVQIVVQVQPVIITSAIAHAPPLTERCSPSFTQIFRC